MEKSSSLTMLTLVTLLTIIIIPFIPIFSFTENRPNLENTIKFYPITLNIDVGLNNHPISLENDNINIFKVQVDSNTVLQKMSEYISNMKLNHITADTIKRILLAHLNSASLILNDNDSDNDLLICSNIIPKFISDIELYEEIRILKSDQANKIHQQIDVLKNFSCNLN